MALLQTSDFKVKAVGVSATIPQNIVAKMMYYIRSVNAVLPLSKLIPNISKFTNYQDYDELSSDQIGILIKLMTIFGISELEGKCFFLKPELCGNSNNQFLEIEQVKNSLLLAGNLAIHVQGVTLKANKIMVYKQTWKNKFYLEPLLTIQKAIEEQQRQEKMKKAQLIILKGGQVDGECALM